jgi:hypothetical protein
MASFWGEQKRRAVFLSFDFADRHYVNAFRSLASNEHIQLYMRDRSLKQAIRSRHEDVIEDQILDRIHGCSVCICLIGPRTWERDWVDWELSACARQKRGLLGIRLQNGERARVPYPLWKRRWVEILPWVPRQFEEAIERAAQAAGY